MKIEGHLDLFSGIGGFSLGLKRSGVEPRYLGFSDIDSYANKVFKRRFPNAKQLGTITDVSYNSLNGQRIDLLTAGFPCQAFSLAGKRLSFEDTRGTLFFDVARILNDYIERGQPIKNILLENVKGLYSAADYSVFATIYGVLTNLNYTVEVQLVNTKWWLPQHRERVYIFGRYNREESRPYIFPIKENVENITNKIRTNSRKSESMQIRYTRTINSRYHKMGSEDTYVLDNNKEDDGKSNVRRLTPLECERLQGFPDQWTQGQSNTQRYKQIGNAVSPPVAKAIFRKIYK